MEEDYKEKLKSKEKKKKIITITIIIMVIIITITAIILEVLILFTDLEENKCNSLECFKDALFTCKKISFIRIDNSYSWNYNILGYSDFKSCNIKVKLIKIKRGDLELEALQNKEMICKINRIEEIFPEKDLSKCKGALKEELQQILIDRMHEKLFKNISQALTNI